jgi:hypothetical protein
MPNYYVENAEAWKAISNIDYFTYFVKAWIPFNAWYRNSYPALESDAEIMQQIKTQPNSFRSRIISLIENPETYNESNVFKAHLAELHYQLERNYIYNREVRISFTNIVVEENPQIIETRIYRGFSYKVEIDIGNKRKVTSTIIDGKSVNRLDVIQNNGYNLDEILNHSQYKGLPPECKRILKTCYEEVNPRKAISLLATDASNSLKIGNYNFVNDSELIAKAIITVIYNLRNSLFHGQLVPDRNTQLVYEPAYHMLRMLVMSLS